MVLLEEELGWVHTGEQGVVVLLDPEINIKVHLTYLLFWRGRAVKRWIKRKAFRSQPFLQFAVIFNHSERVPSVVLKDRDGDTVLWMLYCVIGSINKV